jgi:hypothetical protein
MHEVDIYWGDRGVHVQMGTGAWALRRRARNSWGGGRENG